MPAHYPIVIETARLRLRPFREDDWQAVHKYAVDPVISEFQDWGPNSERDTKNFVRTCIASFDNPASREYFFTIADPETDRHIGGCVLTLHSHMADEASIGYTISRDCWSKGYATEAARAMLKFAFNVLSLRRVTANCDAENEASRRVMEKAGMRHIGTRRNAKFFKGRWRDWLEYEITAESRQVNEF